MAKSRAEVFPSPLALGSLALGRVQVLQAEQWLVLGLVVVGVLGHGLNMLNMPGFTNMGDEGIYTSQAWAILREGRLAPYTYFYDHAPGGWIMVAAWMLVTGGVHTFGGAIDSGRVLMLLLHVAMVPMLYRIARKLGCRPPAAALATFLFSVSPLATYYQRFVLLDSFMMFWTLLSLDLLLDGWGRLSRLVLSGICFGIAILSKETALFLVPAVLFILWQQRWRHQGRFAVSAWVVPLAIVVSWYPVYAALKGELLPAGSSIAMLLFDVGSSSNHVSLVEALQWQATRTGGGMLNLDNQFWQYVRTTWMLRDPVLFAGGTLATLFNLIVGLRDRRALAAGLLGILPLYYMARGGAVLDFYVLAAIPFLCLNLGVALSLGLNRLPRYVAAAAVGVAGVSLVVGYWQAGTIQPLYTERPGDAYRASVAWIKDHLPADSMIVTVDDQWTDLHDAGFEGPAFPNVHNHWKVGADPAIESGVFHDDWQTVDYVIMLPGTPDILQSTDNYVTLGALQHAHLVKQWDADGDTVQLWKVDKPGETDQLLLADSNAYLETHFDHDGAFPERDGTVTSEAQAYALLRAVWRNDRTMFDRTWAWTSANLTNTDGLLAWAWRDGAVADQHSASDADTDAALALLMAGKQWHDADLQAAGTRMVRAIWAHEVTTIQGAPYVAAGDWATDAALVAWNPSYFSPAAYHIFQEVDPDDDWLAVVDSGYTTLFAASADPLGRTRSDGLPPDWLGLDHASGQIEPLLTRAGDTTGYGYDAARTFWRVALDARWSGDGRAQTYLQQAGFLRDEVSRQGEVSASYSRDGQALQTSPSPVGTAGAMAALATLDPPSAGALYASQIVGGASIIDGTAHWGDPGDLYGQEWSWFGTALYADLLPDLWHGSTP